MNKLETIAREAIRTDIPAFAPGDTVKVMVRVRVGGICGSDLHYYFDGGFGSVRIKEPMVVGPASFEAR